MKKLADWVHSGDRKCHLRMIPGKATLFRVTLTQYPAGYWSQTNSDLEVAVESALASAHATPGVRAASIAS